MKNKIVERLRELRRRNNQKGFTLIELLVVISILGILAAVVTMSMVGVTRLAQDRAAKTELNTVQLAVDTMAAEQQLNPDEVCGVAGPTANMQGFPAAATSDNITPPVGHSVALFPRYLRQQTTHGTYTCANGTVAQTSFTP